MISQFLNLNEEERELMYKVPVLVSILVAGADNDIDRTEIKKAVDLARLKQKHAREILITYYNEVAMDFEDKMKVLIQQYSKIPSERNVAITEELHQINAILPKLERNFAVEFYASIRDFARKVAEASGGVLGYMAVGYEESKLVELKMIKDPSA